jgi:tetratricopeptide (TPR) repeat protein
MLDNYGEETKPLFKLLKTEAFRFVIVRYNHSSFIQKLEKDLIRLFPERPFKKVSAQKSDYQHITQAYYALNNGFFFIENFDDVLKEARNSLNKETPQYAEQNERRRGITAGLNLRRDKLAKYPIALFVFVPASAGELYAKVIMEKMPDLWSFRSWMLDLQKETSAERNVVQGSTIEAKSDVRFGNDVIKTIDPSQESEFNRLLALLEKTSETETAYRLTLFPQIVDAALESGRYEQAFSILEEWESLATDVDKPRIWIYKGDVLAIYGQLEEALALFEKAKSISEQNQDTNRISIALERLGNTYSALGNLDKTLGFYEDFTKLMKELYAAYPNNVEFKNGLATSYSKLGETHTSLGNLDKALSFHEKCNRLQKELYAAYPNSVDFKNGLAISYSKLGEMHMSLGNLDNTLEFYEESNRLEKELYAKYPNNVEFKLNVGWSNQFLGMTHTSLGNLDNALGFYEEMNKLFKELYADYPNNVDFKNGLAISCSKLGETHTSSGNLDKALVFFEKKNELSKELYEAYLNNVDFKNGLASSYAQLGVFSKDNLKDKTKARAYFKQAEVLWKELVRDAPQFVRFQKFLGMVQESLKSLD